MTFISETPSDEQIHQNTGSTNCGTAKIRQKLDKNIQFNHPIGKGMRLYHKSQIMGNY